MVNKKRFSAAHCGLLGCWVVTVVHRSLEYLAVRWHLWTRRYIKVSAGFIRGQCFLRDEDRYFISGFDFCGELRSLLGIGRCNNSPALTTHEGKTRGLLTAFTHTNTGTIYTHNSENSLHVNSRLRNSKHKSHHSAHWKWPTNFSSVQTQPVRA